MKNSQCKTWRDDPAGEMKGEKIPIFQNWTLEGKFCWKLHGSQWKMTKRINNGPALFLGPCMGDSCDIQGNATISNTTEEELSATDQEAASASAALPKRLLWWHNLHSHSLKEIFLRSNTKQRTVLEGKLKDQVPSFGSFTNSYVMILDKLFNFPLHLSPLSVKLEQERQWVFPRMLITCASVKREEEVVWHLAFAMPIDLIVQMHSWFCDWPSSLKSSLFVVFNITDTQANWKGQHFSPQSLKKIKER